MLDGSVKWEPIPEFERYLISDEGEVFSTIRNTRVLKQIVGTHGYKSVYLRANGITKTFLVHRLVAMVFIGPCPEGMEVCHLDGNKHNNRIDNLTYGTSSQNKLDSVKHKTHINARKTTCPKNHPYAKIDSAGRRRCGEC